MKKRYNPAYRMPNADGLTDREAAIDAIVRFVNSLDDGDADLCASSLLEQAIVDFTPFQKIGMKHGEVYGQTEIVKLLMSAVGKPLDTTHMATNIRCKLVGADLAELTCCVLAQHFRLGEGLRRECQDHFLNGNLYKGIIVRDGDLWKISRLTISPAWALGNSEVMTV